MLDDLPLPVIAAGVLAVIAFVFTSGMGLGSRVTGIVCAAAFAYFGSKFVLTQMGIQEKKDRAAAHQMRDATLQQKNEALGLKRDVEPQTPVYE